MRAAVRCVCGSEGAIWVNQSATGLNSARFVSRRDETALAKFHLIKNQEVITHSTAAAINTIRPRRGSHFMIFNDNLEPDALDKLDRFDLHLSTFKNNIVVTAHLANIF